MKDLESEYFTSNTYATVWKTAARLCNRLKAERQEYKEIRRNVGTAVFDQEPWIRQCKCKRHCGDSCMTRLHMNECTDLTCHLGRECGNRCIQNARIAPIERKNCGRRGFGMFAAQDLEKRDFIEEYVGILINQETQQQLEERGRGSYLMTLSNGYCVDAMHSGNSARMLNHSHAPNCRAELWWVNGQPHVGIFTNRKIKAGRELTINYGPAYPLDECLCPRCEKKRVTSQQD